MTNTQWSFIVLYTIIIWQIASALTSAYQMPRQQSWSWVMASVTMGFTIAHTAFRNYNRHCNQTKYKQALKAINQGRKRLKELNINQFRTTLNIEGEASESETPAFDFTPQ